MSEMSLGNLRRLIKKADEKRLPDDTLVDVSGDNELMYWPGNRVFAFTIKLKKREQIEPRELFAETGMGNK
jgi:hypothetical protein